jgi:choline kinase
MQAIIMAAGKGNRISALTNGKPKSYLEIGGERLIDRQLRILREHGIKDIIIVVGYQKQRLEADFAAEDVRFVFNPFYEMTNVLPSFWFGQQLLKEDFIYLHADTIFHENIFHDLIAASGDIVLPVDFKPCSKEEMKVKIVDDYIIEINKTMPGETANGEFIGIAKISSKVLPDLKETVENVLVDKQFSTFFEYAIQKLIDQEKAKVSYISTKGYPWNEIDFVEDYEKAKLLFEN